MNLEKIELAKETFKQMYDIACEYRKQAEDMESEIKNCKLENQKLRTALEKEESEKKAFLDTKEDVNTLLEQIKNQYEEELKHKTDVIGSYLKSGYDELIEVKKYIQGNTDLLKELKINTENNKAVLNEINRSCLNLNHIEERLITICFAVGIGKETEIETKREMKENKKGDIGSEDSNNSENEDSQGMLSLPTER